MFLSKIKRISHEEYLMLRENAEIYSKDPFGDKVLRLRDGSILKLFRVKHLISSARIYPYSIRFANNARRLSALKIPTVEIIDLFKIPSIKRTAVQYVKLEGDTFPIYFGKRKLTDEIAQKLGMFLSTLHKKGIYFRSIHLENIVVLPDQRFGLIDVSDMYIYSKPLSLRMRNGNFKHLTRYESHRDLLKTELTAFIHAYLEQSNLSKIRQRKLEKKILKHFESYPYKNK